MEEIKNEGEAPVEGADTPATEAPAEGADEAKTDAPAPAAE